MLAGIDPRRSEFEKFAFAVSAGRQRIAADLEATRLRS